MAEILSGLRKYRIGLTLAHHELHQLQRNPEVASAVMSHPFTRVVFRVGDDDAKRLADGFSYFEAKDLRNLDVGQAVCRVQRGDFDFNLTVPPPDEPDKNEATQRRQEVTTVSRNKYGTARADVEAMLAKSRATPTPDKLPVTSPSPKPAAFVPKPQPSKAAEGPPPSLPLVMPQPSEPPKISEVPKPKEQPVPNVKHESMPLSAAEQTRANMGKLWSNRGRTSIRFFEQERFNQITDPDDSVHVTSGTAARDRPSSEQFVECPTAGAANSPGPGDNP